MALQIMPSFKLTSLAGLLVVTGIATAQENPNQPHPWRRVGDAPAEQTPAYSDREPPEPSYQSQNQAPPAPPQYDANQNRNAPPPVDLPRYSPQSYPQSQPYPQSQRNEPPFSVPATLTIRPGTYVTVRVDQWLSSDKSQQGDTFFASLAEPLVVDGVVVAQRGQTVRGRITDAQKAGRVDGNSHLGVELIGLTLVDGQQIGIRSQVVTHNGQSSVGRDVGAVGATTALGALIGAGAGDGRGAAIGAGAGAAAGLIGVLLTRGKSTIIYPESVLTFQLEAPVTVITDRAPLAFRYADQSDYGQANYSRQSVPRAVTVAPVPVYRPYYYDPYYSPYYRGSGFSVFVGPRYSYGSYGGRRGFRR